MTARAIASVPASYFIYPAGGGLVGPGSDRAYSGLDPECVPNDHMVGLRSWRVDELGRLFPVIASQKAWRPGENVCECKHGGHARVSDDGTESRDHFDPECGCGFYAFHNGDNSFNGDGQVTGVVKGYGRTVIGTRGFRSEKAEILGVVLPDVATGGDDEPFDRWKHRRSAWLRAAAWGLLAVALLAGAVAIPASGWLSAASAFLCAVLLAGASVSALVGLHARSGYLHEGCPEGMHAYGGKHGVLYAMDGYGRCACSKPELRQRLGALDDKPAFPPLPARTAELIRRNYPDVVAYRSLDEMVKAHPLTPPVEPPVPTPDTPDFWERPAKGLRSAV